MTKRAYIERNSSDVTFKVSEVLCRHLHEQGFEGVSDNNSAQDEWKSLCIAELKINGHLMGCGPHVELFYTGDIDLMELHRAFVPAKLNVAIYSHQARVFESGTCICMNEDKKSTEKITYAVRECSVTKRIVGVDLSDYDIVAYIDSGAEGYTQYTHRVKRIISENINRKVLEHLPTSMRIQFSEDPEIALKEIAEYGLNIDEEE